MRGAVSAPGASARAASATNPELHSPGSLPRRNTAFTCIARSSRSERFFSLNVTAGTILFLPADVQPSDQTVVTDSVATAVASLLPRHHAVQCTYDETR